MASAAAAAAAAAAATTPDASSPAGGGRGRREGGAAPQRHVPGMPSVSDGKARSRQKPANTVSRVIVLIAGYTSAAPTGSPVSRVHHFVGKQNSKDSCFQSLKFVMRYATFQCGE